MELAQVLFNLVFEALDEYAAYCASGTLVVYEWCLLFRLDQPAEHVMINLLLVRVERGYAANPASVHELAIMLFVQVFLMLGPGFQLFVAQRTLIQMERP